ncbi:MAG: galactokinase [Bacteroidales bacterium]|jgi:galactokinase|nr:galactokinase [Bacteroidales bacterium]
MIDTKLLAAEFHRRYGADGVAFAAPGRINLIGEHTDYNGGFVFPGAVEQAITAIVRPNGTDVVNAYAADLDMAVAFRVDDTEGPQSTHFRYLYGVVREIKAHGVAVGGFDAVYGGDVPLGAGMSSSAALECCFATALNDLFGNGRLDSMTLARIGQATEHKYVGVKCGIMDQFASMHGREGSLMRLDCRSGEYEYFPWHPDGYRLLLVNSCVKHELVGSPYNERRQSCERVAQLVGVETLRDCSWQQLEQLRDRLDDIDYRRARYVLGETDRVLAVCQALQQDDYEEVGRQMYLTHEGLRHDYEVSCDEIDFLVDEARRCGVSGSRIMGGGFGGCTINLVRDDRYDAFTEALPSRYKSRFGVDCQLIPVVIGPGARRIMDLEQ